MDLLTRPHATTASIARRLILLVLVAGVTDPRPGHDRPVFHRIEVLFHAAHRHTTSRTIAIPSAFAGRSYFDEPTLNSYRRWRYSALIAKQTTGPIDTRSVPSPCVTPASFNIPHQNAADDEPFVTTLM